MKKIYAILLVMSLSFPSFAQDYISTLSYNMGMAVDGSDMAEFIDDVSYKGFSMGSRQYLSRFSSVGFEVGWNVFDKKEYGTFDQDNITATGTQIRYINAFPIMLNYHLYMGNRRGIRIYFGAGAGTYYIEQRQQLGLFAVTTSNWHWGLAPEVGILIPMGRTTSLNVSAKYNYAFEAGDSIQYQYIGLNIGFAFKH